MVRFTVKNNRKSASIRMELAPGDDVSEIRETASEYWGSSGFLIRNGYRILEGDGPLGDRVREDDVLELIPDPAQLRF